MNLNQQIDFDDELMVSGVFSANHDIKLGHTAVRHFQPLFAVIAAIFVGLLMFVFHEQFVKGDYYRALAQDNVQISLRPLPPRGLIYDINAQVLADNVAVFQLLTLGSQLPAQLSQLQQIAATLAPLLQSNQEEIVEQLRGFQGQSIALMRSDLTKEQAVAIESANLPGIVVQIEPIRRYMQPEVFSHIIGYVGLATPQDIENGYSLGDILGKVGVEKYYEDQLKGVPSTVEVALQDKQSSRTLQDTRGGNDVVLNVDANLQETLFENLKRATAKAGANGSAAVIQDVKTGAIMALVSLPSYDNSVFLYRDKRNKYQELLQDKHKPFFNRAISWALSPGSTIKPAIALMALQDHVVDEYKKILSTGAIVIPNPYDPNRSQTFRDWKAHGLVNVREAIAASSDEYFYTVGGGNGDIGGLGITAIAKYLKSFLADKVLGVDLIAETSGFVPTPQWKQEKRGQAWYQGDTYNVSIGQGDLLVTPLWLNSYTAMIANGGTLYKPTLLNSVLDSDTSNVIQHFTPTVLASALIDPENVRIVQEGMHQAVVSERGTAKILQGLPVTSAAKTGTAEVVKGRDTNALFTAYAPYENPQLAITIVIEKGGQGSRFAAEAAYYTLLEYFSSPEK